MIPRNLPFEWFEWQLEKYTDGRLSKQRLTFVSIDDFPEDVGVGGADGFSLEEDRFYASDEGSIDDEGMSQDPSDVAGAEHTVSGFGIVNGPHGVFQQYSGPSMVSHDALGFTSCATRVKDI